MSSLILKFLFKFNLFILLLL